MQEKKSTFAMVMEWSGQKKRLYALSVFLSFLGAVCKLLPYYFIARIVKNLIAGEKDFHAYVLDVALVALLFVAGEALKSLSTLCSHNATFEVLSNIRKTALDKLSRIPLGRVKEIGSGSLKSTLMERVDSIETTLAHILPEVTGNLLAPLVILVSLFALDWRIALVSFIPTAIGILSFTGMFHGYGERYKVVVDTTKNLNETALEYVNGIEVIKAFGKTQSSYQKFVDAAKANAQSYISWMKSAAVFQGATLTFIPYTILSVLPFGAAFVAGGTLPLSDFVMCVILSLGLMGPLMTLGTYTDDLAKVGTVVGEISSILSEPEIVRPETTEKKIENHSVELKNVSFAYKEKNALDNISLKFEDGTVNALVGPSGSGKSTVAKLIAGFYEVKSGEIAIGGVSEKKISSADLNHLVAYVSQDNYLFNESIMENIRHGKNGASDKEVIEAARKSGCYDFIMATEHGFDTVAGNAGGSLSGGERQRISIARAMLKDSPIVILDEATAYIDPENEAEIEAAIARLVKGKTLIMIAHRLYTVKNADRIFVISGGKLAASGSHEELLEKSPLYKKMWEAHISSRDSEE